MHMNWRLLPEDIVCKITQRNNLRRANTCDPALKLLNEHNFRHTKTQTKQKEGTPRRTLGSYAHHTHSLEDHPWSIQQSTSTHTKHFHNIQQQNSNYTQTHCELFHSTSGCVSVLGLRWCGWYRWGVGNGPGSGSGGVGQCYVCVRCESRFSVYMVGPGICVVFFAVTCTSGAHPVLNPVAPFYGYLLPNIYLFIADIAHSDSFV